MFGNLWNKIKAINVAGYFIVIILGSFIVSGFAAWYGNGPLVESKGGIQNHLVWDIKGECYFVRPATNTVYLIRVQDCDKGNK